MACIYLAQAVTKQENPDSQLATRTHTFVFFKPEKAERFVER
jgi:hypothetical protein